MSSCTGTSASTAKLQGQIGEMAYTGAWSMTITHGVAVRFKFDVISFTNLHSLPQISEECAYGLRQGSNLHARLLTAARSCRGRMPTIHTAACCRPTQCSC